MKVGRGCLRTREPFRHHDDPRARPAHLSDPIPRSTLMQLSQRGRNIIGGLVAGGVIGGGLATVTPAAAAVDWKHVWKEEIKPRADKRYYTKKKANQTFTTSAALSSRLGGYYTKAQSDAKYAPSQPLYRGSIMLQGTATSASPTAGAATGI